MRYLNSLLAAAVMGACSINAIAQNETCGGCDDTHCAEAQSLGYKPYSYGFVQVQGGVGTTFTDVSCWKLLSPTFSIGVGEMFTPIVGARLHVNGWKSKGGFDELVATDGSITKLGSPLKYEYNYINSNVDLMVNVLNIFSKNVHRPFDLYVIGGLGLNYAWDNDEFEKLTSANQVASDINNAWGDKQTPRHNLLGHNLRLGMLADVNIAKHWSIGAEIDFNSLDDRFNSKYTNSDDWMMTGSLSLTYKFGFKKVSKPVPATPVQHVVKEEPMREVVPAKPVEKRVIAEKPIKETIFYAIRESDANSEDILNAVAEWCKKYPNKKITIDGYADKGTGNPTVNAGYAKDRAEKAAAALKAKGVPESQMVIKSYGDTVQPFPDNDKNRCVIIEGK